MINDIFIKDTFLKLTSRTYPHGTESELFHLLNKDLKTDKFGNLFIKIGESDVMFTSHLDTATKALSDVKHVFEGDIIKTDGTSILGADDKAGVTVMLYMIENNIPGLYYFFLGEEVGCIGSKKLAGSHKKKKIKGINKVISFDRRGTNSVITFQSSARSCSDKFGEALAKELNNADEAFSYTTDQNGVLTDSIQFTSIYPECTNISVGYQNEHTFRETQDIDHLVKLAQACLLVNWNELPVDRDPSTVEYLRYNNSASYGWGSVWTDDEKYDYGNYATYEANREYLINRKPSVGDFYGSRTKVKTKRNIVYDKTFNHLSYIDVNTENGKIAYVDLSDKRVGYEKIVIDKLLESIDVDFTKTQWDGFKLKVFYANKSGGHMSECDRNDIISYLPELDYDDDIDDFDEVYSDGELMGYK